jgi:hypothetical protein
MNRINKISQVFLVILVFYGCSDKPHSAEFDPKSIYFENEF